MFTAIGQLAVRFRWLVVAIWLAGTAAAVSFLPSLASVTQSGNSAFLPASAPSERAANLARAFGQAGLTNGVTVTAVVARQGAPLSGGDQATIARLRAALAVVILTARAAAVEIADGETDGAGHRSGVFLSGNCLRAWSDAVFAEFDDRMPRNVNCFPVC